MKTRNYLLIFTLIVSVSLFLTGCDDDGDTTKPTIEIISPAEGEAFVIGDEEGLLFEARFSDDTELASYRIDIHSAEGHDHSDTRAEDNLFSFEKSWKLEGLTATVKHQEIMIPGDVEPGKYHLVVYCTDSSGNESHVARNIVLSILLIDGDTDKNDHD